MDLTRPVLLLESKPILSYGCGNTGSVIILFNTENHNFTTASKTMGNFPSGIRWHLLGSIVAAGPSPENHPPSVVLVAWVPHTFAKDVLVPEIWQYLLAPLPQIRCLNLQETFLNHDLHSFIVVGNRMLLLGSPINIYLTVTADFITNDAESTATDNLRTGPSTPLVSSKGETSVDGMIDGYGLN
ncbi:hypothetical protein B0H14DRAFT_3701622 [Mycena olivaceomarginata]|nr:hypothetical protein B0H14DRAFT_3701622 [Mycena olivaceomarginata]